MARKPSALARELLRNFPKRRGRGRSRRRKGSGGAGQSAKQASANGRAAKAKAKAKSTKVARATEEGPAEEVLDEALDTDVEQVNGSGPESPLQADERSALEGAIAEALDDVLDDDSADAVRADA